MALLGFLKTLKLVHTLITYQIDVNLTSIYFDTTFCWTIGFHFAVFSLFLLGFLGEETDFAYYFCVLFCVLFWMGTKPRCTLLRTILGCTILGGVLFYVDLRVYSFAYYFGGVLFCADFRVYPFAYYFGGVRSHADPKVYSFVVFAYSFWGCTIPTPSRHFPTAGTSQTPITGSCH